MVTAITPLDNTSSPGIPYQWNQDINVLAEGLVTGSEPAVFTQELTIATSQTITARTPLMFDGSGNLVVAVQGTEAVGFTLIDVTTTAATLGAPVVRGGCFNPDLLNWPVSYDTTAKKLAAFAGAPTPTQIILRSKKTATFTTP